MSGTTHRHLAALALVLALAAGCGGGDPGTGPADATFASVVVTPSTATLATAGPGSSVTIAAQARDAEGQPIAGAGAATFTSSNAAVATVASNGLVTAVSAGTAQISASITYKGTTRSGVATIVVEAPVPVFETVAVTPTSETLFTIAPANSATFVAQAKDQFGVTLPGAGAPTFSSSNPGVATVDQTGRVTAVSAGATQILAQITAGGVTKTGSANVMVEVAAATATVMAPQLQFTPTVVDVAVGGTVTWSIGSIAHNTFFGFTVDPVGFETTQGESVTLTFPTSGTFSYYCTIHTGMTGVVRVH